MPWWGKGAGEGEPCCSGGAASSPAAAIGSLLNEQRRHGAAGERSRNLKLTTASVRGGPLPSTWSRKGAAPANDFSDRQAVEHALSHLFVRFARPHDSVIAFFSSSDMGEDECCPCSLFER